MSDPKAVMILASFALLLTVTAIWWLKRTGFW